MAAIQTQPVQPARANFRVDGGSVESFAGAPEAHKVTLIRRSHCHAQTCMNTAFEAAAWQRR